MPQESLPRGRWADAKPRCRLCHILLVRGSPPSPCFRRECRFGVTAPLRSPAASPIASSLSGGDYSLGGGGAR